MESAEGSTGTEALHRSKRNRWKKIMVEFDAEIVYNSCQKEVKIPWRTKPVNRISEGKQDVLWLDEAVSDPKECKQF